MELKSEPKQYELVNVTDIDIAFPGDLQTFTLRDGQDAYQVDQGLMTLNIAGGALYFYLAHAHWYAIKHRTIRVIKPETPPVTP